MKLVKSLGIGLIAAGLAVGVHQRRSVASPHCHAVKGTISSSIAPTGCTSPVGLCTAGTITDGALGGSSYYVAGGLAPAPTMSGDSGSFLSYTGTLTITTNRGSLTLEDKGIVNFVPSGSFTEFDHVVAGTGAFANATGTVFFSGLVNATGSGLDAALSGQICGIDHDGQDD